MKPSWIHTLAIQISLCFLLFIALNLGRPQHKGIISKRRNPLDVYFISVTDGFRLIKDQIHLLQLMEEVAKSYKVEFVINISEVDDSLMQNGTQLFPSLKIPWYTTRASKGQGIGIFHEHIKLPLDRTMDIIDVDIVSLTDTTLMGSSNSNESNPLNLLRRSLEETNSNWRVVVGDQPLLVCEENKGKMEVKQANEALHDTFIKYRVNMYLSRQGCMNHARINGVTYIGNPDIMKEEEDKVSDFNKTLANGFLLHKVNALKIVTYFVGLAGEVMDKTRVHQSGKEVM